MQKSYVVFSREPNQFNFTLYRPAHGSRFGSGAGLFWESMASPQLENGFGRVANEIWEALARTDLSGLQHRILYLIFRESYGRSRKEAELSYGELAKRLSADRSGVLRAVKGLRRAGVILSQGGSSGQNVPSHKTRFIFQKDYHRWTGGQKATSGQNVPSTGGQNATSPIYVVKKEKKHLWRPTAASLNTNLDFLEPIGPQGHRPLTPPAPSHIEAEIVGSLKRRKAFAPPTPEEVEAYAKSIDFELDGENFCAHYDASGWMRGKTKIVNWKACVWTWKKRMPEKQGAFRGG